MIQHRCARCKVLLGSPDSLAGKEDRCPACGHRYVVPVPKSGKSGRLVLGVAAALVAVGGLVAAAVVYWPKISRPTPPGGQASQAGEAGGVASENKADISWLTAGAEPNPAPQAKPAPRPGRAAPHAGPAPGPAPPAAPVTIDEAIARIRDLTGVPAAGGKKQQAGGASAVRLALFELDRLTAGRAATAEEGAARARARRVLKGVRVPKPEVGEVYGLYTSGILSFADRNAVATGVASSAQTISQFGEANVTDLRYCSQWRVVPGVYLYDEDLKHLFARAGGAVVTHDGGRAFCGEAKLFNTAESGWLTPLLRRAFSIAGRAGFTVFFHEAGGNTVVIAGIEGFRAP